jgi:hypothetical protein
MTQLGLCQRRSSIYQSSWSNFRHAVNDKGRNGWLPIFCTAKTYDVQAVKFLLHRPRETILPLWVNRLIWGQNKPRSLTGLFSCENGYGVTYLQVNCFWCHQAASAGIFSFLYLYYAEEEPYPKRFPFPLLSLWQRQAVIFGPRSRVQRRQQ